MTLDEFNKSANAGAQPPSGLNLALLALWWDARGNWEKAHELAQQDAGANGSWVHAHLHRVEGDESNAGYWYARAGKSHAHGPLAAERDAIVSALLVSR